MKVLIILISIIFTLPAYSGRSLPEISYNFVKAFEGDAICAYLDERKYRNGVGMEANEGDCIHSQEDRYFYYLNDPQAKLCDKAISKLDIHINKKIILFSLCWNRGLQAMKRKGILELIASKDFTNVCNLILKWHDKDGYNKYKNGLQYRRYREAVLFGCMIEATGLK